MEWYDVTSRPLYQSFELLSSQQENALRQIGEIRRFRLRDGRVSSVQQNL
jgi:hypothetical protein